MKLATANLLFDSILLLGLAFTSIYICLHVFFFLTEDLPKYLKKRKRNSHRLRRRHSQSLFFINNR